MSLDTQGEACDLLTSPEEPGGAVFSAAETDEAYNSWLLMQQVQRGRAEDATVEEQRAGEAAFTEIYTRYYDQVYGIIFRRTGNWDVAQDLTSDTFLRALRRGDTFAWQGRDLGAWLGTVATNIAHDHNKKSSTRREVVRENIADTESMQLGNPEPIVVSRIMQEQTRQQLEGLIAKLNPDYQEVLRAYYFEGHPVGEIALRLAKSPNVISARLYRARAALQRILAPATVTVEAPDLRVKPEDFAGLDIDWSTLYEKLKDTMSPAQYRVLYLHYSNGQPIEEIAGAMGVKHSWVRRLIDTGRQEILRFYSRDNGPYELCRKLGLVIEGEVSTEEVRQRIQDALSRLNLTPTEHAVIEAQYGLKSIDGRRLLQREVAEQLSLSRGYISELVPRVLDRGRRILGGIPEENSPPYLANESPCRYADGPSEFLHRIGMPIANDATHTDIKAMAEGILGQLSLTTTERAVMDARYGLGRAGRELASHEQVAAELSLSRWWVSQLELRVFHKVHQALATNVAGDTLPSPLLHKRGNGFYAFLRKVGATIDEDVTQERLRVMAEDIVKRLGLTATEAAIIHSRYGLDTADGVMLSQVAAAKKLNISRGYLSTLEPRIIRRARESVGTQRRGKQA